MPLCDQCQCEYPADHPSDLCPNCGERLRRCPWCGDTMPWEFSGRTTPCCSRPNKYIRTHGSDLPLLTRGEAIESGPVFLRALEAVYFGGNSTVYRVMPVKRLGDPFLLDGDPPPPVLCLKEIISDSREPVEPYPPSVLERLIKLRHPNIVRLYATWWEGDRFYLLLDWIPGQTAAERYFKGEEQAPGPVIKRMAEEIMDGLVAMEGREFGLMHGDVTPYNIAFDASDRPVLIDLGSIQFIRGAQAPKEWTPHYAPLEFLPPEQRPDEYVRHPDLEVGPASDRYMLGATLYALAVGQSAEEAYEPTGLPVVVAAADRANGTAQARIGAIRPDLPRNLTLWMDDLLNLLPGQRYASHEEARKALRTGTRATVAAPEAPAVQRKVRRRLPSQTGGKNWSRLLLSWKVLLPAALLLLAVRYPSALTHPWDWPRLAGAEVMLLSGKPQTTLEWLKGAGNKDWNAQILMARAQVKLGARQNGLKRMLAVASQQDAPGYVKEAKSEIAAKVGTAELYQGLALLGRGERYPAYVHLKRAADLGISNDKGNRALAQLSMERGQAAAAQKYAENYLKARPNSIEGRLMAARIALSRGEWRKAQEHALRAKKESEKPEGSRTDPVKPESLERTLSQVASALTAPVPSSPSRRSSRSTLQERLERLSMARELHASASLDRQIARYREALD
ncbi:MAG: hypothetical protein KY468_14770 [Armatimonadetes bacterium]|nr:hypothetical protein [Armatimonadota bacterium]